MKLTNQINPSGDQLKRLFTTYPSDTPVCMLNILRYKQTVESSSKSGEEVYQQYLKEATPFIKKVNGRLLWKGRFQSTVIGDSEEEPQIVFIVQYPSISAFQQMLSDPEYLEIAKLRTMSIEYGGLYALSQEYPSI